MVPSSRGQNGRGLTLSRLEKQPRFSGICRGSVPRWEMRSCTSPQGIARDKKEGRGGRKKDEGGSRVKRSGTQRGLRRRRTRLALAEALASNRAGVKVEWTSVKVGSGSVPHDLAASGMVDDGCSAATPARQGTEGEAEAEAEAEADSGRAEGEGEGRTGARGSTWSSRRRTSHMADVRQMGRCTPHRPEQPWSHGAMESHRPMHRRSRHRRPTAAATGRV